MIGTRLRIEVLDTETQASQDYELEPRETPLQIGRDRASDVILPGASASRRHCEIEARPEGWFLRDLSRLGTLKNGVPVSKEEAEPIESGDTIECANFVLRVSILHLTDPTLRPDPDAIRRLMSEMEAPPPPPPRLWLFVDDSVRAHELHQEGAALAIGRGSECDVQLPDPHRVISAVHARVERNWAGVFLYDASRNGVYVNGIKVEERRALADGDRITVAVPEEDPDRPLLVFAAEGSTTEPSGPVRSSSARGAGASGPPGPGADVPASGALAQDRTADRAAEGSATSPIGAADRAGSTSTGTADRSATGAADPLAQPPTGRADRFVPPSSSVPSHPPRRGGLLDQARDNLLLVLVLIVSALALLTVAIWGIVLLRG